jgi:hypothetical protein
LTEAPPPDAAVEPTMDGTALVPTSTLTPTTDPRYGYRAIRYSASDAERIVQEKRAEEFWPHARPNSVIVCAMGNHWKPGSWQKVQEMVQYANDNGHYVAFEEVMDRCFQPYDSLGAMRNECIMKAMQGFEYLLYVDNDVMPEKEDLVRLIRRQLPVVSPLVFEPSSGKELHGPAQKPYTGIQPVRWNVLTMMLWHTGIFRATGPEFWNDSIGADEGYHFQKLWAYGYRPYLDTDIVLKVGDSNPTYPLATNRMTEEESKSFWDKRKEWLLEVPDRKPIDPSNKRVTDIGEFMPFITAPTAEAPDASEAPKVPEVNESAFAGLHESIKETVPV